MDQTQPMPIFVSFIGTYPHPFIYILSMAVFLLQQQTLHVIGKVGPAKSKYLLNGSLPMFVEKSMFLVLLVQHCFSLLKTFLLL